MPCFAKQQLASVTVSDIVCSLPCPACGHVLLPVSSSSRFLTPLLFLLAPGSGVSTASMQAALDGLNASTSLKHIFLASSGLAGELPHQGLDLAQVKRGLVQWQLLPMADEMPAVT